MTFPNLLKAIKNVSKKTDWIARAEENRPVRTMNYADEDGVGKYSLRSGDEQLAELENNAKNKYAQDEVEFEKFIEREAAARRKKYV